MFVPAPETAEVKFTVAGAQTVAGGVIVTVGGVQPEQLLTVIVMPSVSVGQPGVGLAAVKL